MEIDRCFVVYWVKPRIFVHERHARRWKEMVNHPLRNINGTSASGAQAHSLFQLIWRQSCQKHVRLPREMNTTVVYTSIICIFVRSALWSNSFNNRKITLCMEAKGEVAVTCECGHGDFADNEFHYSRGYLLLCFIPFAIDKATHGGTRERDQNQSRGINTAWD